MMMSEQLNEYVFPGPLCFSLTHYFVNIGCTLNYLLCKTIVSLCSCEADFLLACFQASSTCLVVSMAHEMGDFKE